MKQYQVTLLGNIGSLASTIGFFYPFLADIKNVQAGQWGCLGVLLFSLATFLWSALKDRPKSYTSTSDINKYMLNWISNEGRIAIFTRDISWGSEPEIKPKLLEKAGRDELVIVLPESTELTKELEGIGAEIITYSGIDYTPESRFTIVHYGRNDAKVAVGARNKKGIHEIEEYRNGHPFFSTTNDIIEILRKFHEAGKND